MDFELPVLIKQVDVRITRNQKQFLAIIFTDATTELPGKCELYKIAYKSKLLQ